MEKRKIIFGTYDTALDGLWTLREWKLSKPAQVQHFVAVPGRFAPLDLSTYLTDGQPYYESRSLEVTLESSEGDRLEREDRINLMVNHLDGRSVNIYLPDDPAHYVVGRVQVSPEYNDPAHCAAKVSAVCEPWRYAVEETVHTLNATTAQQSAKLINSGRLAVVPTLEVTGDVTLQFGTNSWSLGDGTYVLPGLCLTPGTGLVMPGVHEVLYSGAGTLKITYREAVL
jgi:hypothetical protein